MYHDQQGYQQHCTVHTPGSWSAELVEGKRIRTGNREQRSHDGLRLFMSRPVDAILLEYYLGLLNGAVIAAEIKQVRSKPPIVMLANHVALPDGALKSVGALVAKSDGPHFLLATVHFVLSVKPAQRHQGS